MKKMFHFMLYFSVLKHSYGFFLSISLLGFVICLLNQVILSFKSLKIFIIPSFMSLSTNFNIWAIYGSVRTNFIFS